MAFIMTFQDHFTRWPAAYALKEAADKEVVDCIRTFSHDFGYPATIYATKSEIAFDWLNQFYLVTW